MRILVTGSNGQLGSEIRELSQKENTHQFFFTDVQELDITNKEAIDRFVEQNKVDIIINCAAYTQVDKAEEEKELAFLINATAVQNLAKVCKKHNLTLFHISTDYVFDGSNTIPYNESQPTAPLGIYGESKLKGEELIKETSCNYIIIRTSWLYSIFGENFVKKIAKLAREKDEIKVVFDQVGTPTNAKDLAYAILTIINKDYTPYLNQIYHFSNEGVCSWFDFAISIKKYFGYTCKIKPCHSDQFPTPVKRPHYSVIDKTKIKKDFNIEIFYWQDSLEVCIEGLKGESIII